MKKSQKFIRSDQSEGEGNIYRMELPILNEKYNFIIEGKINILNY
jgi:hypothetical protein